MNEEELKALVGDKAFEAMSAEQKAAAIAKYTPPKTPDPKPDPKDKGGNPDPKDKGGKDDNLDINDKVKKEKEAEAAKLSERQSMEKAIAFNYGVANFLKDNVDALPADFGDLIKAIEKETYDTQVDKAAATKAAFVKSFFSIQANVDFLTASQKARLEDFNKLTVNARREKIEGIYEDIFEPAFETFKRVKKAEELGKSRAGFHSSSKVEDGYKARLMALRQPKK